MLAQLAQLGFSIGGAVLGNKSAGDAADAASAAAQAQAQGYHEAISARKSGTKKALGFLAPYEASGRGGQKLLDDALGINGPEAQRLYYQNFQNDPGFEAVQGAGIGTVEQSRAAGGGLKSGATMKALMDFGQRLQQSVFQDRLTRLESVGRTGATTAANMANVTDSGSRDVANYRIGQAGATAGGIIGAENAHQAGDQNLLKMLGYGTSAIASMGNDMFGRLPPFAPSDSSNPAKPGSHY